MSRCLSKVHKVCGEGSYRHKTYIVIATNTGDYIADFAYRGLFLERNPIDKRETTVYWNRKWTRKLDSEYCKSNNRM